MKLLLLILALSVHANPPLPAASDSDDVDATRVLNHIGELGHKAKDAQSQANNPDLSPDQRSKEQQVYADSVQKIQEDGQSLPQNEPVNFKAGTELFKLGESRAAVPFLNQSVALARDSGDAKALQDSLLARAQANYDLKNYSKVVADADELLKKDPNNSVALQMRSLSINRSEGSASQSSGLRAQAQASGASSRSAQSSLASSVGSSSALAAQAQTTAQRLAADRVIDEAASQMSLDPGTARRMLDHLLFEGGPNARALALRSQVDLALGDKPSALSDANQAVALNARLPQAYEARAKAKQALGQPRADVLADLQTASELDPQLTGEYQAALAGHFGPQEAPAASAPASFGADRWLLGWLPASLQEKLSRGGAAGLIAAVAALVLAWLLLIFWPRKKAGEDLN